MQQTDEWFASRAGKVTASRVADVLAKGRGATRAAYMAEIICERLTGEKAEGFTSAAMQWGIDHEADAVAAYEFMTNATTELVGFVSHPTIANFGASPDRLVGGDGLLEIKCPNTATHLEYMLTETIPRKYVIQMQTQMACTGRKWCDFISFDPRLDVEYQLWIKRVHRDDDFIAEIEEAVTAFLLEVDEKLESLRAKYGEK